MSNNNFFDFSKFYANNEEMSAKLLNNMPQLNLNVLSNIAARNAKTVSTITNIISENLQEIINKNTQQMQKNISTFLSGIKSSINNNNEQDTENWASELKENLDDAAEYTKELAFKGTKISNEILDTVSVNTIENINELYNQQEQKN